MVSSPQIDVEGVKRQVAVSIAGLGLKLTRDRRIVTALQTPIKECTAEQAALRALGRRIGDGTFV